ncbi:MAG: GtrA family protein [Romboutsia sp.]
MTIKMPNLKGKLMEYIKFNIVGITNFLLSQVLYITLYLVFKLNYIVAYTITSIVSITASYFFNSKYTFKDKDYSAKKFYMTVAVYIGEYLLNMGVIIIMVNFFGIGEIIAPFLAPIISTPPAFFLMRLVIKR